VAEKKSKSSRTPRRIKPSEPPDDLQSVVAEALHAKPAVLTSELKKALPRSHQPYYKEAQQLARDLAHHGDVHRWVKGKTEIFFARDPIKTLDEVAPGYLAGKVLSKAALKSLIAADLPQHERLLEEWLPRALQRGLLFLHPGKQYAVDPPAPPEPDVRSGLRAVFTALRKALTSEKLKGVSKERIAEAILVEFALPSPVQPAIAPPSHPTNGSARPAARDEFLYALQQLMGESPQQALVSVRELRPRLMMSKEQFDELALALSRENVISLHHHDHPNSLSDAERSQLILDARGTHYIAIAPRRG
jgi:hypothetical protein